MIFLRKWIGFCNISVCVYLLPCLRSNKGKIAPVRITDAVCVREEYLASVPRSILSPPGPNNANVSNTTFQALNHFSFCPTEIFLLKTKDEESAVRDSFENRIQFEKERTKSASDCKYSFIYINYAEIHFISLLIMSSPTQLSIQSRNYSFLYSSHSPNLVIS